MGSRLAVIHAEPRIPWQAPFALKLIDGLKAIGIDSVLTRDTFRHDEGFPILLGTTRWREVERTGEFLLVDRCSFGDTNTYVSLVWNGHGRRGDHRVPPDASPARWEHMGVRLEPWRSGGSRVVLCGQTETYSPHYRALNDWYRTVKATHFRPHPSGELMPSLPIAVDFADCRVAVTLNSSVAVKAVMQGTPTVTMDEGAMAWDVTGHTVFEICRPERLPWCHRLAWTQWSHDEISQGHPIAHLFER